VGIDAEMFIRTKEPVSDEQVKQWNYQLGLVFGHSKFWIWQGADGFIGDRRALERIEVYEQDGPDIVPGDGETFLRLNPCTRYYGEGYERGDLPFLIMLAEWCEASIPGVEVWYGGDSSGVLAKPFDMSRRHALFMHLCSECGRDYFTERSLLGGDEYGRPRCDFCDMPMTRFGFGNSYAAYCCHGCGQETQTRDGGKTWQPRKKVGGRRVETDSDGARTS
jgi:hypothetical protein